MAPKQGVRKRPAAGSHETVGDLQPGLLLDAATRLGRRADNAAVEAAARYPTPGGCSISCICIGQPLVDDKPSPYREECEPNAKHWLLPCSPERPSHIRLAFQWEIFEGRSITATEAASCVVRLDKAEEQGVPLPSGWAEKIASLFDESLQSKGTSSSTSRARSAVYSKQALSSPGAPTDRGLLPRTGEEAARVDRQALVRRAEAAAKSAALGYSEACDAAVRCIFVGQPSDQYYESLSYTDCVADPQLWINIPHWTDRIKLAFRWDIFEVGSVIPLERECCVVTLKDAEQYGVPLPSFCGSLLAKLADSLSKGKGAC